MRCTVQERGDTREGQIAYHIKLGANSATVTTTADGTSLFYPRHTKLGAVLGRNANSERLHVAQQLVAIGKPRPAAWIGI